MADGLKGCASILPIGWPFYCTAPQLDKCWPPVIIQMHTQQWRSGTSAATGPVLWCHTSGLAVLMKIQWIGAITSATEAAAWRASQHCRSEQLGLQGGLELKKTMSTLGLVRSTRGQRWAFIYDTFVQTQNCTARQNAAFATVVCR